MMARTPASVTRTARRAAERGEGGLARTNSSVMDLANNRFRLKFILQAAMEQYCSKFLADQRLHLRHGYRRCGCQGKIGLNKGGDYVGSDGGGKESGPAGPARLGRGQGSGRHHQD